MKRVTKKSIKRLNVLAIMLMLISSCVEVKSYQRNFLNDPDMELSDDLLKSYENNFQNYRESATGGNSGKTGGGCGCN